jgi:hypothetical protein
MAPASTVFQDDYAKASEPEHVHEEKKRQTRILDANYEAANLKEIIKSISTINDIERNKILLLLRKCEHLFDGILGDFEIPEVKFDLKENANAYHAKAFPVPKIHHDTLKHEIIIFGIYFNCAYA